MKKINTFICALISLCYTLHASAFTHVINNKSSEDIIVTIKLLPRGTKTIEISAGLNKSTFVPVGPRCTKEFTIKPSISLGVLAGEEIVQTIDKKRCRSYEVTVRDAQPYGLEVDIQALPFFYKLPLYRKFHKPHEVFYRHYDF